MEKNLEVVEVMRRHGRDDEATDTSHGEYCLHIFKNTSMGMSGVETYQVRDNKIVFESATVQAL